RLLLRAQQGQVGRAAPARAEPKRATPAVAAGPIARELEGRFQSMASQAESEANATMRDGSDTNDRFAPSLAALAKRARVQARRARSAGDGKALSALLSEAEYLAFWLEILRGLVAERRDRRVSQLLGDADSLAEALYQPIVEYCRNREIKLTTDFRVATVIG